MWGIGVFKNATGEFEERRLRCNSDGMSQVSTGSSGLPHNRNIAAASTIYASATNSATWLATITDVEIVVPATASLTKVLVVYDAQSDAIASAQLSDAGGAALDVAYDWVLPGTRLFRQFTGTVPGRTTPGILRIDVLPFGANTGLGIGAL